MLLQFSFRQSFSKYLSLANKAPFMADNLNPNLKNHFQHHGLVLEEGRFEGRSRISLWWSRTFRVRLEEVRMEEQVRNDLCRT